MAQKTPHIRDLKNKENISKNMIKVNNKNTNTNIKLLSPTTKDKYLKSDQTRPGVVN